MRSERKKRRQAARRLKRSVLQNHMTLRGWVPVLVGPGLFGIRHESEERVIVRTRGHAAGIRGKPATVWSYMSMPPRMMEFRECRWDEMREVWVRGLRAMAIQQGWL